MTVGEIAPQDDDIDLDIVIVNWNSGAHLSQCLMALGPLVGRTMVVDNGSQDQSADRVEVTGARLVRASRNLGFGAACNLGAAQAKAGTILFLNPDTRISAEAVKALHRILSADRRIGIIGPALTNDTGQVVDTCSAFPRAVDFLGRMVGLDRLGLVRAPFQPEGEGLVDQVMGACLLVRREAFDRAQGFDPRFFLYFEEVDLCHRLHMIGFETHYWPKVQAIHVGHGSSGQAKGARLDYWLTSRLIYARRHFGLTASLLIALASLLVEPVARAIALGASGRANQIPGALAAYVHYATKIIAILARPTQNRPLP